MLESPAPSRRPEPAVWVDGGDHLFCVSLPIHDIKVDVSAPVGGNMPLATIQVREAGKLVYQVTSADKAWAHSAYLILTLMATHAHTYGSH